MGRRRVVNPSWSASADGQCGIIDAPDAFVHGQEDLGRARLLEIARLPEGRPGLLVSVMKTFQPWPRGWNRRRARMTAPGRKPRVNCADALIQRTTPG